ncbi:MAG TPA: proton-conducting transporter membrane subunit [Candidatus Acidoferrum sp.]|nr:proton-conducting transporter membrane subunit [Candidatus Acidoferrum sp.]
MIHLIVEGLRKFLSGDGVVLMPELELVLFACGIVVLDRWLEPQEKYWNAMLALAGTAFSGFTLYVQFRKLDDLLKTIPDSPGLLGLHQSFLIDHFFLFFAALLLAGTALAILLSLPLANHNESESQPSFAPYLFGCAGMMWMISGVDLLGIFAGLQCLSVSCYLLTRRAAQGEEAREASKKYRLLWLCGSSGLAIGFVLLYALFRTTNLGRIATVLEVRLDNGVVYGGVTAWPVALAFAFVAAGALLLVDAAPLHWFAPPIAEKARTSTEEFLAATVKVACFALLVRLFSFLFVFGHEKWVHVWAIAAVVSLLWGTIAASLARNLKRLLVYGAMAHTGFLILGLVAGSAGGFQGIMYYLGTFLFMTAGAFGVLMVLEQSGSAIVSLDDLHGFYHRSPATAALLLIFLLALAGVPPTAGFPPKYLLIKSVFASSHQELAVFASLSALASLYYYGRVAVHAWKRAASDAVPAAPISFTTAQTIALTACVFVSIAAGVYPEPFLRIASYAFGQ